MTLDKKLLVLILITIIIVSGVFLDLPSLYRYIITILGQFSIILVSVLIGFERIKSFTFKSTMGKSLVGISLGMLSWGFGNLAWFYYNAVMQIEVPYPSLADVGYIGMIPFASFGLFLLLKNIKIGFDVKTILKIIIFPILAFLLTYWLFIQSELAEDVSTLEKILNVTYPMSDVVFLSFTLVILSLIKGGKLFKSIGIICLGFIIEAIADFSFSWTTAIGTYYTGSWVDIVFALAFFTLGIGMYYTKQLTE